MNHLQKDIDSLENEKINLRERLKAFSSKKGDIKQTITFGMIFHRRNLYSDLSGWLIRFHLIDIFGFRTVSQPVVCGPRVNIIEKSFARRAQRTHQNSSHRNGKDSQKFNSNSCTTTER